MSYDEIGRDETDRIKGMKKIDYENERNGTRLTKILLNPNYI